MQNKISKGDKSLTLFVINTSLLLEIIMNDVAKENKNATFKKRAPDGSKLKILAIDKNSNENPKSFLVWVAGLPLKNRIEIKITVK